MHAMQNRSFREVGISLGAARLVPLLVVTAVLILLATLPGCNTVNGLGKDIEKGGQKLQEASGDPEAQKQEW